MSFMGSVANIFGGTALEFLVGIPHSWGLCVCVCEWNDFLIGLQKILVSMFFLMLNELLDQAHVMTPERTD